ncbi:hypothetical protein RKD22_000157 [Streptomyces pristinaespiralis]
MAPVLARLLVGHLHPLVVRGEGHAEVETEDHLVHEGEQHCLADRHGCQQQAAYPATWARSSAPSRTRSPRFWRPPPRENTAWKP